MRLRECGRAVLKIGRTDAGRMPRRVDEQSHGRVHSIDSATLQAFVERVFVASDVSVEDAKTAASILVLADLRGIDSYGFPP
jgi:hypothetical protein